jgi:hypothetical protein
MEIYYLDFCNNSQQGKKFLEILTYNLASGKSVEFHNIEKYESIPLHQKFGIDVVAFGQSVDNSDSYYLIRAFNSPEECQELLQKFYASNDWIHGPRKSIIDLIETSVNVKLWVDCNIVDLLRKL